MNEPIEHKIFRLMREKRESELIQVTENAVGINLSAVDEEGKSFAHRVAIWGAAIPLERFVIDLRCPLNIVDSDGQTAEQLDWSNRFKKCVGRREVMEVREAAELAYKVKVQATKASEEVIGGYKSGMVFTQNFSLFYSSTRKDGNKNKSEKCFVPITLDPISGVDVQTTQAVIEASWGQRRTHVQALQGSQEKLPENFSATHWKFTEPYGLNATNYLLVNVGCIVSTVEHKKNKVDKIHDRKFISAPVFIPGNILEKCRAKVSEKSKWKSSGNAHSEEIFYQYIVQELVLRHIICELLHQNGLAHSEENPLKIYSLVFDLCSSQDVCNGCEYNLGDFEKKGLPNMRAVLTGMGFHLPVKEEGKNLKIIFRIISARQPSHSQYRRDPVESTKHNQLEVRAYSHVIPMDLKKSETPLILHSDEEHRAQQARWYDRENYTVARLLPRYSVFDSAVVIPHSSHALVEKVAVFKN